MNWVLNALVPFFIPMIMLIGFVLKTFEKSNGVTVQEMYKFEYDIQKNYSTIFKGKDCYDIAAEYKLLVKTDVDPKDIDGKESQLGPTNEEDYNGQILIAKTDVEHLQRFRCYHELVHYLKDVGAGKVVRKTYGKDPSGETSSHREQIINYYAAAIAVPNSELREDLDKRQDAEGNSEFVKRLMGKYKQPKVTIERRIREVNRL